MLADVVHLLRCSVCGADVVTAGGALRCAAGHAFDVARQGYVNMLGGSGRTLRSDTADMVAAREEFLRAGHFAHLARHVAQLAAERAQAVPSGCVVDAGAGTGYYLATALETLDARDHAVPGVAVDLSPYAARRSARAHPRIGSVIDDVWRGLPLRDGVASVLLNVFAPRNSAEFRRVLHPDGALIVASATPRHVVELREPLSLLAVDEAKPQRLASSLRDDFEQASEQTLEALVGVPRDQVEELVLMGPSAWHVDWRTLGDRVRRLPDTVRVTTSFVVTTHRPLQRTRIRGPAGQM